MLKFSPPAAPFLSALRAAGPVGVAVAGSTARSLARVLLDRGLAHPVVAPRPAGGVDVVVPFRGSGEQLTECLQALAGLDVIVVDDCSPDPEGVAAAARSQGARVVRHAANRGPAAARNTGLGLTGADLVAFVDGDCRPRPGWLELMVAHFDDPSLAAVAPRVLPEVAGGALLGRYETAHSALDMGRRPELVQPGGRLSFVPTAALVVRRRAMRQCSFAEELRFGEDVDLVWRLRDRGWLVRYEPAATVEHSPRVRPYQWLARRHAYGTSAGALARRHPGHVAPVRVSAWSLAALALVAAKRPASAAATVWLAAGLLHRRLRRLGAEPSLALATVAKGVLADAAGIGQALRREWWPLGAFALGRARRSPPARLAVAAMLAPLWLEWRRQRPRVSPAAYVGLRLVDDAAYGTGVMAGAWRAQTWLPLIPVVRLAKGRKRPRH
jgi:mycofactocin system glycosyltransferase